MSIFTILILFLLLAGICGFILVRFGVRRIVLNRSFPEKAVFCGDTSEMVETVENSHPVIIPWLRVESRMPPGIQFGHQENLDISGELYHRSMFTIMPYQRIVRTHKILLTRRGVYQVGHAAMTCGDLTGWFIKTVELDLPGMEITVYPRILDSSSIPRPVLWQLGEWTRERTLLQDPFMIYGIRPYLPGDSIRDIHWKATARCQSLQVRVHEWNALPSVMLLINSQTREDQWGELMDYEQETVEHVISLAATMCLQAFREGAKIGFSSNMCMLNGDERISAYVSPMGPDRKDALLDAFARLKVVRTVRFATFLDQLLLPEHCAVVLLSLYAGAELPAFQQRMRQQGHTVIQWICGKTPPVHPDREQV